MAEFLYATSHLAGNFTNPDNAVGNTPSTWAGPALNNNTSQTSRWAIGNPVDPLTPSATHTIRIVARKGSNSGNPTITMNLWVNGVSTAFLANASVTSTTGQTISGTFNTSAVSDEDGVEVEVIMSGASGGPSVRNAAQISHIEWEADTTASAPQVEGAADLAGTGAFSASGKRVANADVDLPGAGALAASAKVVVHGSADLAGTAVFEAVGDVVGGEVEGAADLSGSGAFTAQGTTVVHGSADMAGAGALDASGKVAAHGEVGLAGAGALSASGQTVAHGATDLQGQGQLEGSAKVVSHGATDLSGSGTLEGSAKVIVHGAADLSGTAVFEGVGDVPTGATEGEVDLAGTGSFDASAKVVVHGSSDLAGSGSFDGAAKTVRNAAATLIAQGVLAASGKSVVHGVTDLAGAGAFSVIGDVLGEAVDHPQGEATADVTVSPGLVDVLATKTTTEVQQSVATASAVLNRATAREE